MQKKSPKSSKTAKSSTTPARQVTAEERRHMIAEAAYFRAQSRGFAGADPNDDWLTAEREVDQALLAAGGEQTSARTTKDNGHALPFVGNTTAAKNRASR